MASESIFKQFGLAFTHNRLRVPKIQEVVAFYTERFGMKCLNARKSTEDRTDPGEEVHMLGFTGTEGAVMDKKEAFLELHSPKGDSGKSHRNYGKPDSVYWKIGVCLPDVNKAQKRLQEGGVRVTEPNQLGDIGYLCHLQDEARFSMEVLQFYFKGNTQPYTELLEHPLGQQPVLGMVTLRVKDIKASLSFYRDTLGMQLICTEDISDFGFHLYFLAFTEEKPPNPDLGAVENREWTYQRPYTVLELQAHITPHQKLHFQDMDSDSYGFLGLGFGTTYVEGMRTYLVQRDLQPTEITEDPVLHKPCCTIRDPDGTPIRIAQF